MYLGVSTIFKAFLVRDVTTFSQSQKVFYSRDVVFDITVFPYKNVLVPRPVSLPNDSIDVSASDDPIVGAEDDAADAANISDVSIDLLRF